MLIVDAILPSIAGIEASKELLIGFLISHILVLIGIGTLESGK
jgi:hypothetical protein